MKSYPNPNKLLNQATWSFEHQEHDLSITTGYSTGSYEFCFFLMEAIIRIHELIESNLYTIRWLGNSSLAAPNGRLPISKKQSLLGISGYPKRSVYRSLNTTCWYNNQRTIPPLFGDSYPIRTLSLQWRRDVRWLYCFHRKRRIHQSTPSTLGKNEME